MWKKFKKYIIKILFPAQCISCKKYNTFLCKNCLLKIPLRQRLKQEKPLDLLMSASFFHNKIIKKLIHGFKYDKNKELIKAIIKIIDKYFKKHPKLINTLQKRNFWLVPIPLSYKKHKIRGFNQAKIIAQSISKKYNLKIFYPLAKKTTKPQARLNLKQRRENIKGAFFIKKYFKNKINKNICLIDDTATTKATLKQAAKILKENNAKKIWAFTIART